MAPKLIACRAVASHLRPFLPPDLATEILEMHLHLRPARLRARIQQLVDAADGLFDPIFLGYGACSGAIVGIAARASRLVAPKSHDCIELFLGSRAARLAQLEREPGTYFATHDELSGGFAGLFPEFDGLAARFGGTRAEELIRAMLRSYRLLAYIRMPGAPDPARDREALREIAARLSLEPRELEGATEWLEGLIAREWDDRFVVLEPGSAFEHHHFTSPPDTPEVQ